MDHETRGNTSRIKIRLNFRDTSVIVCAQKLQQRRTEPLYRSSKHGCSQEVNTRWFQGQEESRRSQERQEILGSQVILARSCQKEERCSQGTSEKEKRCSQGTSEKEKRRKEELGKEERTEARIFTP